MSEKVFFENRDAKKLCIVVDRSPSSRGLVFVMHGLGGFKEQPHILTFAQAFLDKGYTVVRFDTAHTFGESEGNYEDASVTNYYEDLEDVINWSSLQDWYQEPFWLVGHSLGGISTALYAEKFPEKVVALEPISTVVSGELSFASPKYQGNNILEEWEETGFRVTESISVPGRIKRLKWGHVQDRLKYDLLLEASKLTMPVLLVVGDQDKGTPPEHQRILFDAVSGDKEMHVIANAPHTFVDEEHLNEIKEIFSKWIEKVEKKE